MAGTGPKKVSNDGGVVVTVGKPKKLRPEVDHL
jgi:hypothetical protein